MNTAGHGPNIGHGFVKYVIIDQHGRELEPITFPAMIARAQRQVAGAIGRAAVVEVAGAPWWTGEDAMLGSPLTLISQDRLQDAAFIPALLKAAIDRFGYLNGATGGACVTGLPATWAADVDKARMLGERIRAASNQYQKIRVIPEPLGLIYAALLDNNGQIAGDPRLQTGRVAVVDLGHYTVDTAEILRLTPVPAGLNTWQLGTSRPLQQICGRLSEVFELPLTLHQADTAIRRGRLQVAGQERALPTLWDRPLIENGQAIASRLVEAWGRGNQFDAILIGGGGAELEPLVEAITRRFPHATAIEKPQTAIARGYARLARRLGSEGR